MSKPNASNASRLLMVTLLCGVLLPLHACSDSDAATNASSSAARVDQPLRPLIYTELPDLTPRAAAIRERRLMRELLLGASADDQHDASWGRLQTPTNFQPLTSANVLGEAMTRALFTQDEALWDHVFVSPSSYAGMVHVKPEAAHTFVDELLGKSAQAWDLFHIEHASEAPEGGLSALFEFRSMTLGQGRTLSGKIVRREDDVVAQHWGNVLTIGLRGSTVEFELRVPKILRVVDHEKSPSGEPILAVAAPIEASSLLQMFIAAGMHLKPELLRSQEYPFPLAVGNFWRYRRYRHDQSPEKAAPLDSMDAALLLDDEQVAERGPGESLLEILAVERYNGVRLVQYRISYDDQEFSMKEAHWLVSPRTIYHCSRACVRHVEDLNWLLNYMQRSSPVYMFPIRIGKAWNRAQDGEEGLDTIKDAAVRVQAATPDIEVPAGKFHRAYVLEILRDEILSDPFFTVQHAQRAFVQGQGVVRQELRGVNAQGEPRKIIEELVEARIMP